MRDVKNPKAQAIELEHVVQEGMDISGRWNRMFAPRPITDYDLTHLDAIRDTPGAASFGWCYQCAKCVPVCPVDHVGDYGPRKLFRRVQLGLDLTAAPDLWLCTTCANCLRVCPKEVNMIEIIPALREQALLAGNAPAELQKALENSARYGNPMGEPGRKRADWTKDSAVPVPVLARHNQPVDVLWYVGDLPSYHPRGVDASLALARVLHGLDVDFGILGPEERSDGDSQRLAGEQGLFELLAEHNIKAFAKYEYKQLLVTDPHALNALRLFYPALAGREFEVVHYTTFLAPLLDRLPLVNPLQITATFHDPCYLGRHHGEFEAPRAILRALPGVKVVEMARNRQGGFCCGGGGSGMWLDGLVAEHTSERLADVRVREAIAAGADTLVVACPYEVSRFEDAVKNTGNAGRLAVRDVSELIAAAMP